ncbi:hypothetical protein V3C99_011575 [Haemonchus contortus]|uniref:Helitron_like_N domain-containing protein n=1 Tax=Haemonchus contortus TaxID=6289 RepID=A0A7I4Y6B7_HAECO
MLHYFCRNGYDSRRHPIRRGPFPNCTGPSSQCRQCREISHFLRTTLRFCSTVLPKHTILFRRDYREDLQDWLVWLGVHDLQPDATSASGQLYTIHGVMANSVDVPLLFAITTRKNERVCERTQGRD